MKDKIFLFLCLILSATLFIGHFVFPKNYERASETTVFLNPSKISNIDKIRVKSQDLTVEIVRSNENWLASADGVEFFASREVIFDLLAAFSAKRKIFVQTKDKTNLEKFSLDDKNAVNITVFAQNSPISDIDFGTNDAQLSSIFFCAKNRQEILKTKDNFSQFLTKNLKFWADMDLIPLQKKFEIDEISKIEIFADEKSQIIKEANFAEKFLSARAGDILNVNECKNLPKKCDVKFTLKNEDEISLQFFKRENDYLVLFSENNQSQNFVFSISEWTFERLFPN